MKTDFRSLRQEGFLAPHERPVPGQDPELDALYDAHDRMIERIREILDSPNERSVERIVSDAYRLQEKAQAKGAAKGLADYFAGAKALLQKADQHLFGPSGHGAHSALAAVDGAVSFLHHGIDQLAMGLLRGEAYTGKDGQEIRPFGYELGDDATPARRYVDPSRSGDYGADPLGDGTFRMVPSGDVVDAAEKERRLRGEAVDPEAVRRSAGDVDVFTNHVDWARAATERGYTVTGGYLSHGEWLAYEDGIGSREMGWYTFSDPKGTHGILHREDVVREAWADRLARLSAPEPVLPKPNGDGFVCLCGWPLYPVATDPQGGTEWTAYACDNGHRWVKPSHGQWQLEGIRAPAARNPRTGEIREFEGLHTWIGPEWENGFTTDEGEFLDRQQAAQYVDREKMAANYGPGWMDLFEKDLGRDGAHTPMFWKLDPSFTRRMDLNHRALEGSLRPTGRYAYSCGLCGGDGQIEDVHPDDWDIEIQMNCPHCHGAGVCDCPKCKRPENRFELYEVSEMKEAENAKWDRIIDRLLRQEDHTALAHGLRSAGYDAGKGFPSVRDGEAHLKNLFGAYNLDAAGKEISPGVYQYTLTPRDPAYVGTDEHPGPYYATFEVAGNDLPGTMFGSDSVRFRLVRLGTSK